MLNEACQILYFDGYSCNVFVLLVMPKGEYTIACFQLLPCYMTEINYLIINYMYLGCVSFSFFFPYYNRKEL